MVRLTQIGDALRRFGVAKGTTALLLVHVTAAPPEGPAPADVATAMDALVDGSLCHGLSLPGDAPADLVEAAAHVGLEDTSLDWPELSKVYKLRETHAYADATPRTVEPLLCSTVATKFLG